MAGLCAPLSTLRRCPRGHLRMTRGRCGSLLLHRDGLAPSTPCRSPGALRFTPEATELRTSWGVRFVPTRDSCTAPILDKNSARIHGTSGNVSPSQAPILIGRRLKSHTTKAASLVLDTEP